jgi:hypothetical protein
MDAQSAKENAMKLAINKGYALHRVEKAIYAVDINSNYYLVSKSTDYDSLWQDAYISLKMSTKLTPLEANETDNLFISNRDKLKKNIIEKALKTKHVSLFHRDNAMYGYNKEGEEVFITKSEDKDNLWQKTLENL